MRLGIIGVGHLAGALLTGLARAGFAPSDICLSPRGHGPELARRQGHALARDNADLVARCSHVLLCVRPADAAGAVVGLPWRADHVLMSACAGVPRAALARAADPAAVVRLMPITAAEKCASPTLVYPMRADLAPMLDAFGSTIALADEDQFEAATVYAAVYGWVQKLIAASAEWSAAQGLDPGVSRQVSAATFVAAGVMQADASREMGDILQSLLTPGGITEAGLDHLDRAGAVTAWQEACALVLHRLQGTR